MTVPPHQFAALARSSPWRWRSLRFTVAWHGRLSREPVRAWVRRPDSLRVETLTGELRQSGRQGQSRRRAVAMLSSDDRRGPVPDWHAAPPELDDAGLVARRPWGPGTFDDSMYVDYRWVAMLDPVELADGQDRFDEVARPEGVASPVEVRQLTEVDHHGRPAWEAVVRTTDAYDPRCSCCALLFGVHSEQREAESSGPTLRDREPQLRYPDAHRVRLDVLTGVCVLTEEIGGSHPGTGHEVQIEAVDEEFPGDLFRPEPPVRGRWRLRRSRQALHQP